MSRKEALLTEAIAHFAVDFACFFLLAGSFFRAVGERALLVGAGFLIFLLISYGIRPFAGWILDEHPRFHSQALGCLLVGISCLFPQSFGWFSLFLAAVGSGLFHTGAGGETLAFARGFFTRSGAVLAAGAPGAALGTLSAGSRLPSWLCAVILGALALGCFLFAEARKYPRKIRSFRHSVAPSLPAWGVCLMTLFPVFAASLTLALIPVDRTDGIWALLPGVALFVGRLGGGIAADRFGPRKTAVISFSAAILFLTVFTHIPWLYLLGLAFLSAPVSVTLGAATAALPSRPHFTFGLWSSALLLGTIPAFFRGAVTPAVRLTAALLLATSVTVCALVYTDHCKMFVLTRRRAKGGLK